MDETDGEFWVCTVNAALLWKITSQIFKGPFIQNVVGFKTVANGIFA